MPALPSLISMMSQLVASPSISCSQAHWDQSNKGVIQLLENWLSSQGFQCEVMPLPDQPNKFNLIATLGTGDGGLVLAGHTDTVPYDKGRWKSDPFKLEERDHKLYGLGSCDMKGFFAIVLDTVRQMQLSDVKQPLIILATADEESSMSGARALVDQNKIKARYALIGEPTSLTPIYAHKGIMMERIQVTGQAGHSSNPSLGNNALDAMHAVMSELMIFRQQLKANYRDASFVIDYPTMNFGCIHGGDNPNRICGRCELEFDLRALPGMSNQALMAEIAQILPRIEEKTGTIIQLSSLFADVPSFYTPIESDIIKACEALTNRQASTVAFATEGSFLNQLGMETLILGPGSIDQAHQPNEFMALDQIQPMQEVIRGLIERFCLQTNEQKNEEQRA
ncbi:MULTISPECIES: acetylornithine deacetylase [Marinomonas]|uniref:Acetylornithine deacetylase n=1 Tax=Marinomonas arctica TaxID=383750 RepID=A0A7H1J8R0_9GAMM|nr:MULTISPECIES: acetylornithine deacetylase [Marinomonas]MCS7487228.1 acetylornithine deacetylase [Marinomonas sp. BSi20414]QNT06876.1 acetylornithine deacetylase [Marinomonas arctica]GGN33822.1 acetylornithine deacetylase [Marinomonas arctica]